MNKFIATFGYVGYMRPAPGTWGSLAALPTGWAIVTATSWPGLAIAVLAAFFLGWWATHKYIAGTDNHDPSEVVIDEVAGQWVALLPVAIGASHDSVGLLALWPGILTAFLAFRFFDILKPGPIGWADRRGDALGVILDDIFAGIAAAIVVMLAAGIFHGL